MEGQEDKKEERGNNELSKKSTDSHNNVICLTCVHFANQICLSVLSHYGDQAECLLSCDHQCGCRFPETSQNGYNQDRS